MIEETLVSLKTCITCILTLKVCNVSLLNPLNFETEHHGRQVLSPTVHREADVERDV